MSATALAAALLGLLTARAAGAEFGGRDVIAQRPMPSGLQVILAEGAGRVVVLTCADVQAVVETVGRAKAEAAARRAGATDKQIVQARKCLK